MLAAVGLRGLFEEPLFVIAPTVQVVARQRQARGDVDVGADLLGEVQRSARKPEGVVGLEIQLT